MAQQIINVGTVPNDGTGDGLRTAYIKCNQNFSELYNVTIAPTSVGNGASNIGVVAINGNIVANVGGTANVGVFSTDGLEINGNITTDGNITVSGTTSTEHLSVTGNVTSDLIPDGNGTRNLGNASHPWGELFVSASTIHLGEIQLKDLGANILGIFGPDGTTPATIDQASVDTTLISNGTSNVKVGTSNGNATVNINSTSNVVVFASTGAYVNGLVSATGNANITGNVHAGNVVSVGAVAATGNVSGTYIFGDGGFLSNITVTSNVAVSQIANGSTVLAIESSNGNIGATVGGAGVVTLTSTGANIIGYAEITGNLLANTITSNSNISSGNLAVTGTATISGAATVGTTLGVTGTVTGGNFTTVGNIASNVLTVTNNVTANNISIGGGASSNSTTTGALVVVGGIGSQGNLYLGGMLNAVGNISGNYFVGNGRLLTGIDTTQIQNGTSNVRIANADGNATVAVAGNNIVTVSSTGAEITGNISASNISSSNGLTAVGNIVGGNLSITSNIAGGNLSLTGAGTVGTTLSVTGNVTGGNIETAGLLSVTGNISGGNIVTTGLTNTGILWASVATISTLANITASTAATSTVTGSLKTAGGLGVVGNAHIGGQAVVTGNISGANITSSNGVTATGTVTGGNLSTGGNVTATGTITATGNITGGNLKTSGVTINSTGITGATTITATGNITGGNLITAGLVSLASITKTGSNGVGNIGSSTSYFNTVFAKAASAEYADLAENYLADEQYAPGTVLSFGGDAELTISLVDHDPLIAGVVSTNPAYHMNTGLTGNHVVALALTGRVPCWVQGPISRGDMLVSAGNGRARAEKSPAMGTVIGKALEAFDGDIGTIEIVVGRL